MRSATRAQAVAAFGARPQGAGRAHANANDSAGGGEGGGDGLGRPGEGGEVVRLLLELRLLADVGLVVSGVCKFGAERVRGCGL